MTSALFSPIRLNQLELPNRIVVSPMCQYEAMDGCATDWHLMHLGQFAMGAGGLVILEATHVSRPGRISHRCLGLYSDDNEAALARVLQFCRRFGVAKFGIQLAHAGRKASGKPPQQGSGALGAGEDPWVTLAPSALAFGPGWHTPVALDHAGLAAVKQQFVDAAGRAARLGFDVCELHMAHGYLLHEFMSPISNVRSDEYGGSLSNRMRFPLEVFAAVKKVWPAGLPVGARITGTDWLDGGWSAEDAVAFAHELKKLGCDFVDVTSGQLDPRQKIAFAPGYNIPFAEKIKKETGITVMGVGMIAQARQAEDVLDGSQQAVVVMDGQ